MIGGDDSYDFTFGVMKRVSLQVAATAALCCFGIHAPGAQVQVADSPKPRLFGELITLRSMPDPNRMTEIQVPARDSTMADQLARLARCEKPPLDEQRFRALMASAKPIRSDDPSIVAWHYAQWCTVAFHLQGGRSEALLFLGGRGLLTQPNGERGMFQYTYPEGAQP